MGVASEDLDDADGPVNTPRKMSSAASPGPSWAQLARQDIPTTACVILLYVLNNGWCRGVEHTNVDLEGWSAWHDMMHTCTAIEAFLRHTDEPA